MAERARAVVRAPDGGVVALGHGDLIGRLGGCALALDDGRISEAHALVSLRGDALMLLALRGRFAVEGRTLAQLRLEVGQRVELALGLAIEVLEVVLPDAVLAVALDGRLPQVLLGTNSLQLQPTPALRAGFDARAAAWIWSAGPSWRIQRAGHGPPVGLLPGARLEIGGCRLEATLVPLVEAGAAKTWIDGALQAPLRIVARYQSVHVLRSGEEVLVLDGAAARILSELVAFGGPVAWQVAAREIWSEDVDEVLLRGRWDAALSRLRARLRAAGVRPDLVRSDRQGHVELVLHGEDVAVDET